MSRVLTSSKYKVTNSYENHLKTGNYAMGIDLVSTNDKGEFVLSNVKAHSDGRVIYAGDGDGYGKAVWIEHGQGYVTGYGHLASLYVKSGETVKSGQNIGLIGSTGTSTGVHLHFEVRKYKEGFEVPPKCTFWDSKSFMNRAKFDWVNPTEYVNGDLPLGNTYYRVQVGAYLFKIFAKNMYNKLTKAGYSAIGKYYGGYYHIQTGAFVKKENADRLAAQLRADGFDTFVTMESGEDIVF